MTSYESEKSTLRFLTGTMIAIIIIMLLVLGRALYLNDKYPYQCYEYKTVLRIVEVQRRRATVEYSDGTVEQLYETTIKPGDKRCIRSNRNMRDLLPF